MPKRRRVHSLLFFAAVLLPSSFLLSCTTSVWESRTNLHSGGTAGRLLVPRIYEPIRPGSVYPNRKAPQRAVARPALILFSRRRISARFLEPYAERGLVVHVIASEEGTRDPAARLRDALLFLSTRPEVAGNRIGVQMSDPAPELARAALEDDALFRVVLVNFRPDGKNRVAMLRKRTLVLSAEATADPSAEATSRFQRSLGLASEAVIEKWYRGGEGAELFRDAAEWFQEEARKSSEAPLQGGGSREDGTP